MFITSNFSKLDSTGFIASALWQRITIDIDIVSQEKVRGATALFDSCSCHKFFLNVYS